MLYITLFTSILSLILLAYNITYIGILIGLVGLLFMIAI